MASGRLHIDLEQAPAVALARGEALLGELSEELPIVAYGAELSSAGVVLGAYQHAPHALRTQVFEALALPLSRRATGGVALYAPRSTHVTDSPATAA